MVLQFHYYASSTVFYKTSESTRRTSWQFPLYISDDAPIHVLQTVKLYKATHKFPEGLKVWKWWSDTAITSRHWSCEPNSKPQTFDTQEKQNWDRTKNHPKVLRPSNYVMGKTKRNTSQVVANLPWFQWYSSWPCEKLSLISSVHPLAIIDHPLDYSTNRVHSKEFVRCKYHIVPFVCLAF